MDKLQQIGREDIIIEKGIAYFIIGDGSLWKISQNL